MSERRNITLEVTTRVAEDTDSKKIEDLLKILFGLFLGIGSSITISPKVNEIIEFLYKQLKKFEYQVQFFKKTETKIDLLEGVTESFVIAWVLMIIVYVLDVSQKKEKDMKHLLNIAFCTLISAIVGAGKFFYNRHDTNFLEAYSKYNQNFTPPNFETNIGNYIPWIIMGFYFLLVLIRETRLNGDYDWDDGDDEDDGDEENYDD